MPEENENQKWADKVRGKSWTQLAYEREEEINAKIANIMTPEYIDSWGKVEDDEEGNPQSQ